MHSILYAKVVWEAAKDADMVEKVWTASIIAKKSRGDIEIYWSGGADVLGPTKSEGAGGTGGAEKAGNVSSGVVIAEAVDTRI